MKVYIVEDSHIMVERIKNSLSLIDGLEISGISSEQDDALEKINILNPDLIILDISLKKGNGIEVLRRLKLEKPFIRIIILTNYILPEFKNKCLELGADYFFDKARDFEQINAVFENIQV